MTAIERLEELEKKHEDALATIKAEAITEIAKKRADLKAELTKVDALYEKLTGKKVDGSPVDPAAAVVEDGKRDRWTDKQYEDFTAEVRKILKESKTPLKMTEIVAKVGAEKKKRLAIAFKALGADLIKTGEKTKMRYSLK